MARFGPGRTAPSEAIFWDFLRPSNNNHNSIFCLNHARCTVLRSSCLCARETPSFSISIFATPAASSGAREFRCMRNRTTNINSDASPAACLRRQACGVQAAKSDRGTATRAALQGRPDPFVLCCFLPRAFARLVDRSLNRRVPSPCPREPVAPAQSIRATCASCMHVPQGFESPSIHSTERPAYPAPLLAVRTAC